jgi:Immunoglobulin-like domain of bacterial spore germination
MARSSPRRAAAVALVAGAALAGPLAASAAAAPTAKEIRIGTRPGVVRVVVEFSGGRVQAGEVVATDPDPFPDGRARLPVTHAAVRTTAAAVKAHGVRVRIAQGSGRIVIRLTAAKRRFKYVRESALTGPSRIVLDLYRAKPPSAAAEIRAAPDRCLTLTSSTIGPRRVRAAGREQDLFEHGLVVRLRGARGGIVKERAKTAAAGRWRVDFRYPERPRQAGTLEAVALSAKDGTLDCLVQVRVTLGG